MREIPKSQSEMRNVAEWEQNPTPKSQLKSQKRDSKEGLGLAMEPNYTRKKLELNFLKPYQLYSTEKI